MAGFPHIGEYAAARAEGRARTGWFRKQPSQASVAGWWVDISMAGGAPPANYYASEPLAARVLDPYDGIPHGDAVSPASLHLAGLELVSPTAGLVGQYMLCDYLLAYPFIDGDSTDEQAMDNTVTLPRYADGDGVMVMAVAQYPTVGGGSFVVNYVDEAGVSRTTPTQVANTTASAFTNIVTSQQALTGGSGSPFLQLASPSKGVRSITSLTCLAPTGGNLCLVLMRPLAQLAILEVNTPHEKRHVARFPDAPQILDGAFLGMIMSCAASVASGFVVGRLDYVWSK